MESVSKVGKAISLDWKLEAKYERRFPPIGNLEAKYERRFSSIGNLENLKKSFLLKMIEITYSAARILALMLPCLEEANFVFLASTLSS